MLSAAVACSTASVDCCVRCSADALCRSPASVACRGVQARYDRLLPPRCLPWCLCMYFRVPPPLLCCVFCRRCSADACETTTAHTENIIARMTTSQHLFSAMTAHRAVIMFWNRTAPGSQCSGVVLCTAVPFVSVVGQPVQANPCDRRPPGASTLVQVVDIGVVLAVRVLSVDELAVLWRSAPASSEWKYVRDALAVDVIDEHYLRACTRR